MPTKTQSILIGGVVAGVLAMLVNFIPFVGSCIACLLYLGAGLIAVWHYTNTYNLTIPSSEGVKMGAQAGVVGFLTGALLGLAYWVAIGMPNMRDFMEQRMAASGQANAEGMNEFLGMMDNPLIIVGIVGVSLLVWVVLGLAGGAIGAGVFKKGDAQPLV